MSRDFRHILACVYNIPLAITPEKLAEIEFVLTTRIKTGQGLAWVEGDEPHQAAVARDDEEPFDRFRDVAVIPIHGTISQRPSIMSSYSGGASSEQIGKAIDKASSDSSVKSIVLDIDSPGGSIAGLEATAAKIAAASVKKKCVAVANSMCASAAYWLGSQASEMVCCPAGQVGSVGVIAQHVDESRAEDMAGIKTTLIHAGQYKAEFDSSRPLTSDAKAHLQSQVDELYERFVRAVASGRKTSMKDVKENYGQGRMYLDTEAARRGMVDRVSTLEDVLTELLSSNGPKSRTSAESERSKRDTAAMLAEKGIRTR